MSYAQYENRKLDQLIAPAYEIMQAIWGDKAGGHAAIAGTPRENKYDFFEVQKVFDTLKSYREHFLYEEEKYYSNEIPF